MNLMPTGPPRSEDKNGVRANTEPPDATIVSITSGFGPQNQSLSAYLPHPKTAANSPQRINSEMSLS